MKYYITALICCLLTLNVTAQQAFTLEEAMEYAVKNHIRMKTEQSNLEDAEYQIKEAVAVGYPQVNAEVGLSHYLQIPNSLLDASTFADPSDPHAPPPGEFYLKFPAGVKNTLYGKVELTQLLFNYTYIVGIEGAKRLKMLTERTADITIQDIRNNVRDAYLPNLILDISEETLNKNIENLKKTLAETEQFYKNGFVGQLDVDRLKLSLSNLEIRLEGLQEQRALTRNVLKFQMNYPIHEEIELTDNLEKFMADAGDPYLEGDDIFKNRAEFGVFEQRYVLNDINVRRLKAGYLPSVGGFASYQQTMNRQKLFKAPIEAGTLDRISFIPGAIVGLAVNVPIFDGFQKKNAIQRALVTIEKIKQEEYQLKKGIEIQVANARAKYRVAEKNIDATQVNIDLAQRILDTSRVKYREGIGSSLEIWQAEQSLYTAQDNNLKAVYDLLVAKAELDKALGN